MLNKSQLKRELSKLGISVKGNFVSKKDIVKTLNDNKLISDFAKSLKRVKARRGKGLKENYPNIDAIVKDLIETAGDDIDSTYETSTKIEEIEHESRDGFISSNDGGYRAQGFTNISYLMGTGFITKLPKKAQTKINKVYEENCKSALEQFKEENASEIKDIPEDKLNYHDLYELGKGKLAEKLSGLEDEHNNDDNSSVMLEILCMFNDPNSFTVQAVVNWEAPYHRSKGEYEDYFEKDIDVDMTKPDDVQAALMESIKEGIKYICGK